MPDINRVQPQTAARPRRRQQDISPIDDPGAARTAATWPGAWVPSGVATSVRTHSLRPDSLLARREDPLGVERILEHLVESPLGMLAPVEGVGDQVHVLDVGAVDRVA